MHSTCQNGLSLIAELTRYGAAAGCGPLASCSVTCKLDTSPAALFRASRCTAARTWPKRTAVVVLAGAATAPQTSRAISSRYPPAEARWLGLVVDGQTQAAACSLRAPVLLAASSSAMLLSILPTAARLLPVSGQATTSQAGDQRHRLPRDCFTIKWNAGHASRTTL